MLVNQKHSRQRLAAGLFLLLVGVVAHLLAAMNGVPTDRVGSNSHGRRYLQGNSANAPGHNKDKESEGPSSDGSCPKRNNPVCVDGDVTYQNACLAIAQEKYDYTNGPCNGQDMLRFVGSDNRVSEGDMKKFRDEGFDLVGEIANADEGPSNEMAAIDDMGDGGTDNPDDLKKVTRVTVGGMKYVTKNYILPIIFDPNDGDNESEPLTPPTAQDNQDSGMRSLQIGVDTRIWISDTNVYPYWRLGEIDWSGEGGCSGSIIGTNKVLTAAHCVFNSYYNQWQVPKYFAPGRKRKCTSSGCTTVEPWGRWPVLHASVSTAYINWAAPSPSTTNSQGIKYDMAVLTIGTNWAGSIGSKMGTLPIVASFCTVDPNSCLAGYPGSKPDGTMWSTGKCPWWGSGCNGRVVSNTCDISGGQSGFVVKFEKMDWMETFSIALYLDLAESYVF